MFRSEKVIVKVEGKVLDIRGRVEPVSIIIPEAADFIFSSPGNGGDGKKLGVGVPI